MKLTAAHAPRATAIEHILRNAARRPAASHAAANLLLVAKNLQMPRTPPPNPRNPRSLAIVARRAHSLAGLAAVITYCKDKPPDQATIDAIKAAGNTYQLSDCAGNVAIAAPAPTSTYKPVYTAAQTQGNFTVSVTPQLTQGPCLDPLDAQCVARQEVQQQQVLTQYKTANNQFYLDQCMENLRLNNVQRSSLGLPPLDASQCSSYAVAAGAPVPSGSYGYTGGAVKTTAGPVYLTPPTSTTPGPVATNIQPSVILPQNPAPTSQTITPAITYPSYVTQPDYPYPAGNVITGPAIRTIAQPPLNVPGQEIIGSGGGGGAMVSNLDPGSLAPPDTWLEIKAKLQEVPWWGWGLLVAGGAYLATRKKGR